MDHVGLFGKVALHLQIVTGEQLQQAVEIHGRYGNTKRMGEIMLEMGWITEAQIEEILEFQNQYEAQLVRINDTRASPQRLHSPGGRWQRSSWRRSRCP